LPGLDPAIHMAAGIQDPVDARISPGITTTRVRLLSVFSRHPDAQALQMKPPILVRPARSDDLSAVRDLLVTHGMTPMTP
jgi:hypothetical protein